MMAIAIAAVVTISLKGTAPVNTCDTRKGGEQWFYERNTFTSYLNHDHRKKENICFLARRPLPVQDFWCSAFCVMAWPFQGAQRSIQVLNYPSEAEIGDSRMVGVVYEDI